MSTAEARHLGEIGFIAGTNRGVPYVAGYELSDVFRAYKLAAGQTPETGALLFRINSSGNVLFGSAGDQLLGHVGGSPESVVAAPVGSFLLRNDPLTKGQHSVWFKASGIGSTGWVPLMSKMWGNTASRPTDPSHGDLYFDGTLDTLIARNWANDAWMNMVKCTSGAAVPSGTPKFIGQMYVDTSASPKKVYVATGTSLVQPTGPCSTEIGPVVA